jgi:glutathione synthase/RimK-type ligase-like ATP-grasp enzyme
MNTALKAAGLIGDGLYGVDLKETEQGEVLVIEVNDNPSVDSGVEDKVAGDDLYDTILSEFMRRIERRLGLNR